MWFLFAILLDGRPPGEDPAEDEVQELVRRARAGDAAAAHRIYELFVARIFRTVRPLCVSDAEAEDLTQDTFVNALAALGRYEARSDRRFVAWLVTIALNAARKRAKRRGREDRPLTRAPEPTTDGGQSQLDEADARRAQRDALLVALAELSDRDRHIVCLRWGAGLGADEVAQMSGVRAANVRKICQRQRRRLLARLTQDESEAATTAASDQEARP